ncbi:MAG: aminopeptidase [Bacteroidales bacterium]|nr:aminopeptidase [Bacteroidales bacterium]
MNYRTFLSALALAAGTAAASAFGNFAVVADDGDTAPADTTGFAFTDVIVIPTTSVKDQNKSGTCWCFAGTSMFEDEIVRRGGEPLDLSEMFTVRNCYLDKADRYVRMYGETNFAAGGSIMDVPYVWKRYGAVPDSVYSGLNYGEDKHVHVELDAILKAYLDAVVRKPNKRLSTAWRKGVEAILDAYLGEVPETFTVNGKTYTPMTYAESLPINPNDYMAFTSYTHHPYNEPFVLEVADNWLWAPYQNVELADLKEIVDNALANGFPVVWAADVSEGGFKWKEGFAVMPKKRTEADMDGTELARWVHLSDQERNDKQFDVKGPVEEIEVTPELRQEMFDRQETTDDHGMEIVGTATDRKGNRYYKVKNSWDTNQIYDGFFYVSEPYFLAKTLSVLVHKDAVPSKIAKKFNK